MCFMGYNKKFEAYRKQLYKTYTESIQELSRLNDGEIIEATREELEGTIIPELARLIDEINNNSFPTRRTNRFLVSFSYAFRVWGWNIEHPTELFIDLCQLNKLYKDI